MFRKKQTCWKYDGFVSVTTKRDYINRIFLQKGQGKWEKLLKIIGINANEMDQHILSKIKNKMLHQEGVRIQKNSKCVNKRYSIFLSSTSLLKNEECYKKDE